MAREELHSLILEHLEGEGVSARLVSELRATLEHTAEGGRGSHCAPDAGATSELLSLFQRRRGPGSGPRRLPAEEAVQPPQSPRDGSQADLPPAALPRAPGVQSPPGPGRGVCPAAAVALLSLVFLPCVTYSSWYIDELFAAVRNPDARGETPLRQLLAHDFWGNPLWDGGWTHKSYRPLVVLSYALQYRFNGGVVKPQPLRSFNVALHTANSLLLHALLRRHGVAWHWACLGAGLFAAHPVHVENVVYLVGRADALATHCWLLASLTWPRPRAMRRQRCCSRVLQLLLAATLAVIGGLCKESGFCVLLQLAAGEVVGARPLRRAAPLLTIFGVVFFGRSWFTDGTKAGFSYVDTPVQYHDDAAVRLCTYLYFHAKYAQLLVFPWTLSWDYSLDALPLLRATWRDARLLAVLAAYLGVAAVAAWALARRSRLAVIGLSNVLVPFVPASNLFFVVGVTVGERLLYPCNVGASLLLAAVGGGSRPPGALCAAAPKGGGASGGGGGRLFGLGLALLAVYVYRCGLRVSQWSSHEALFGADAASYPGSTKARHQFGTVLHKQSRFDEALVHFEASLGLFKDSALTEYCVAQILIETDRAAEARSRFEHILDGHGLGFGRFNMYALYVDYGFTLMLLRQFEDAVPYLRRGLEMNEDVPHGLNALGYTMVQLGRRQEAEHAFSRGLHYEPANPYLLSNLGVAQMLGGQVQAGADHIVRAVQVESRVPAFAHNFRVLGKLMETRQWPTEQFVLDIFYHH